MSKMPTMVQISPWRGMVSPFDNRLVAAFTRRSDVRNRRGYMIESAGKGLPPLSTGRSSLEDSIGKAGVALLDAVKPPEVFDALVARRGRLRPDRHVADSSQHNPGPGSIIVFELDPDGTQLHVLEYPLTIRE